MLSPGHDEDDDDDSHLCIKCNATIIGLAEYVKHRKERCGKKYEVVKSSKVKSLDTWRLGADVFFQSLELQSSAKKHSLLTPAIPASTKSLTVDRTKALDVPSTSRDIPRMCPLDNNMRGEDWIGGHRLGIGNSEADNQTKLINAVASISGAVKKDIPSSSYNIVPYDFKGDDDTDEASEDSEDDDDEEPSPLGGKWKPPPHHTGGKWRPDSPDHEEWDSKLEEHSGGKWRWRLLQVDTAENDEDYDAPPPGHTKGKWVPGAQDQKTQIMQTRIQTKSSVQYWCGACNRRLGSRAIYEKHLMSNLHMKKILPENDLEFSGHMEPSKGVGVKRTSRPSRYTNESIYQIARKKKTSIQNLGKKKRIRKPFYTLCLGCKSRVRRHLMGKHLISHYHFRKATDISSVAYQKLILDNMDAIVHQSPFQCSPCKFYTNWLSNFMQHWFSGEHVEKMALLEGNYWCSFCKFECENSDHMLEHISSSDHGDVVAVINRSMPIIIRRKTVFQCRDCSKVFRYNIEMKKHCQETGHSLGHTATDKYQELHNCIHCKEKFRSSKSLASHLKNTHKQKAYLCLVCSKKFLTSKEAKKHRHTSEHRIRRKEWMNERGEMNLFKDLTKKCPHCLDAPVVLKNILELKEHIRSIHPEIKKKCPKCGMSFILSQEVTWHVRSNACRYQPADQPNASAFWNCSQCPFTTDSQAEYFFHEVLHTTPSTEVRKIGDEEKLVEKFVCPLCSKLFRKASLRYHIRQHTFERPFVCTICGASFTRETSLANHWKVDHVVGVRGPRSVANNDLMMRKEIAEPNEESQSKQCEPGVSVAAPQNVERRQHKCPHEDCSYVGATITQLVRHGKSHGDRFKHHKCPYCHFKTDQSSHLKRHKRCHEGEKPYACPHCTFVCASLENLRKHVLHSGRHPGLPLYACRHCDFSSNTATALRSHLTKDHKGQYDAKSAIESVKRLLMQTG